MAQTGRPPKPVEVKRRAGNPGKRALPPAPPASLPAPIALPPTPTGLAEPGSRLWVGVWTAAQSWLSPPIDAATLELACRVLDEIVGHRGDIETYGRVIEEPVLYHGEPVAGVVRLRPNPALVSLRNAEARLERWLSALALTPTDRARLGLAQVKAQSKLEALLERRAQRVLPAGRGRKLATTAPDPGPRR